jgi:hypothetical protein
MEFMYPFPTFLTATILFKSNKVTQNTKVDELRGPRSKEGRTITFVD